MKKYIYIITTVFFSLSFLSCGNDFLNVTPIDNLAGNNFWKTDKDVESFTLSIYNRFRAATMTDTPFFVATGELRGAPVYLNSAHTSNLYVNFLRGNQLGDLLTNTRYVNDTYFTKLTQWNKFYEIIQLANILYTKVDNVPSGVLTAEKIKTYKAEAVFMRNICYFFLVRQYGDVPYYLDAYQPGPLPRMNMVEVLKNGIVDLEAVKNDLPWTYEDSSLIGVRPMHGSVIVLLMHMNMWAAGFDKNNKNLYYEKVADLGREIMEDNNGAYKLIPLENSKEIFSGRSKEGLFEIVQNVNTNESFNINSVYSNFVVKTPLVSYSMPFIYYDVSFMRKIYPPTETDKRATAWFDVNMYNNTGTQQFFKFVNPFQSPNGQLTSNVGNQIVFRYTDAVLLRAEALANLDRDAEAKDVVNLIRVRAGAQPFNTAGKPLKDDIYWERVRELMGEGHYFYDLVRTGKVVDGNYSFVPISVSAFNEGAWTWPIHPSALDNNPFMTLNQYWN